MVQRNKFVAQPAIKLAVSAIMVAIIIAGDILLKKFTVENIKGTDGIVLIPGVIKLTYTENDGAAWSMFKGEQEFFIILTVAVLVVVAYLLVRGYVKGWFGVLSLASCIGGTIGNFIDRVKQGYVVDMFETLFVEYPIFNIADICLTLGCIALGVYILFLYDRSVAAERMPAKGGFSLVCSGCSDGVQSYCAEKGEVSRKKVENNHADL